MSNATILYLTDAEISNTNSELIKVLKQENIAVIKGVPSQTLLLDFIVQQPCLVLLECQRQGVGDLTLCQEIQKIYSGLFILLSHDVNIQFNILALDLGVDAIFSTSQGLALVVANVKALLRRFTSVARQPLLTFDNLVIDTHRREVIVAQRKVELSSIEFEVIWLLARNSGSVITRSKIYSELYNQTYNGYDRSIDLYISRIRQKIGDDPGNPMYLKTVRGIGYQFVTPETTALIETS